MIVAHGPPGGNQTTRADFVRFHDDKSLYTGVYKAGGPSNSGDGQISLAHLLNRSPADARGVKSPFRRGSI